MGDLGKLIVAKSFKKMPKVQYIAQSGHTDFSHHDGWVEQRKEYESSVTRLGYIWKNFVTIFLSLVAQIIRQHLSNFSKIKFGQFGATIDQNCATFIPSGHSGYDSSTNEIAIRRISLRYPKYLKSHEYIAVQFLFYYLPWNQLIARPF